MSILWSGGEDIDFPNGAAPQVNTTLQRTTYARCTLSGPLGGAFCKGSQFPSGAVTSCWFSFRAAAPSFAAEKNVGLGQLGTDKGLFIGTATASASKWALWKFDGTNWVELATETGTTVPTNNAQCRFDLQLINYGATATLNFYYNGQPTILFTGNAAVVGLTGFDSVFFRTWNGYAYVSEIIVADEDTRAFPGLLTLAPTGPGTTDQWTGTYSDINGVTLSDVSPVYTNVAAQDEQFAITDLPAGFTVAIKAIKISVRAAASVGATATKVALGFKNGATVAVGSNKALTNAYATYESLYLTDPTKAPGTLWATADLNGLEIALRSAS